MAKFRKKPVVIEAVQWFGNEHMGSKGLGVSPHREPGTDGGRVCQHCGKAMLYHGWVPTLESGHVACPGDWIITGVKGEKYPCKPDIFEATYEPVTDDG